MYSCSQSTYITNRNISYIYQNDKNNLSPNFYIFHQNDSITNVYISIKSKELLYLRKANDKIFNAQIGVSYILYNNINNKMIVQDSATLYIKDSSIENKTDKYLLADFEIKAKYPNYYILDIYVKDKYRKTDYRNFLDINKTNKYNRQNFLVVDSSNNIPVFNYLINRNKTYIIKTNNLYKKLYLLYYCNDFSSAPPPFSSIFITPENLFPVNKNTLTINNKCNCFYFKPDIEGIYYFTTDSSKKEGLSLYYFNDNYPYINTIEDMIKPLRYITSKEEYFQLINSPNSKETVDNFWLSKGRNIEKSKELINIFYTRVENANKFFQSYTEGWKTDRGMIYIVMGPPNIIYKGEGYENWIYGEENNVNSVSFAFRKVKNKLTDNDYVLNRSLLYKNPWYRAVESWRQGYIY